jgi:hypothetical protein
MEITENDVIDAVDQSEPVKKPEPKPTTPPPVQGAAAVPVAKPTAKIVGEKGEWQIVAPAKPEGDTKEWLDLIKSASHMLLDLTANEEDVMLIFKKNKVLFDTVKATDGVFFKEMMGKFTERKTLFTKE